jgi:hypothetical protein
MNILIRLLASILLQKRLKNFKHEKNIVLNEDNLTSDLKCDWEK